MRELAAVRWVFCPQESLSIAFQKLHIIFVRTVGPTLARPELYLIIVAAAGHRLLTPAAS